MGWAKSRKKPKFTFSKTQMLRIINWNCMWKSSVYSFLLISWRLREYCHGSLFQNLFQILKYVFIIPFSFLQLAMYNQSFTNIAIFFSPNRYNLVMIAFPLLGSRQERKEPGDSWVSAEYQKQSNCPFPHSYHTEVWTEGIHIPCYLLLQSGNAGHIEHYPEEKQRLIGKFVQLLLQRLFQFNPAGLLALAEKPKAKVVCLDKETK